MLVTVMSDASWCPRYSVAGYGYWIASARGKKGGGGKIGVPVYNVNCAEMMAIGNALYHAVASQLVQPGDEVLFQTDSMHSINAFNGRPVTKTERQQEVIEYVRKVTDTLQLTLRFKHVKGHSNLKDKRSLANAACDKRAKAAMRLARSIIAIKNIEEELNS